MDTRDHREDSLLTVAFHAAGTRCVLTMSGDLTRSSLPALEAQIEQLASTGSPEVVLDVAGLRRLDPVGTRVLLGIDQYVRALGGRLTTRGAHGQVAGVLAGTPLHLEPEAPRSRERWSAA